MTAESPAARLLQLASGFRVTQALYVVARLGVADRLAKRPQTCGELAPLVGAHERSLFRVMRALASLGVFGQDSEDRFSLNSMSSLLVSDSPDSVRAAVLVWGSEMYRAAGELLMSVKTGKTAFDSVFGEGHFEYLGKHPEESETFNTMMAQMLRASPTRRSIERYDFTGRNTVVDVGGGVGELLASVLLRNPHLMGILYDLPAAVKSAPDLLRARGVYGRVKIFTGSAFVSIPGGGDVYTMSRVLHDHPDDVAVKILRNCRKVIPSDGVLLIGDSVVPGGSTPSQGKMVDLTMLIMTGGRERTERDWKALLNEGGFTMTRADGKDSLVEARPS